MSRQKTALTRTGTEGSVFFPSFQKEMNRMLEHFRSGFPTPETFGAADLVGPVFPAIDIIETEETLKIVAEVPDVKEQDLDATITGDVMVLKGRKSADREDKEENYHLIERQFGSFRRQIPLGFAPADDAVDAQYSNGVLTLVITKPDTAKADVRKIDIKKN